MSAWVAIAVSVALSALVFAMGWGAATVRLKHLESQVAALAAEVKCLSESIAKLATSVAVLRDRGDREPTGRHSIVLDSPTPEPT